MAPLLDIIIIIIIILTGPGHGRWRRRRSNNSAASRTSNSSSGRKTNKSSSSSSPVRIKMMQGRKLKIWGFFVLVEREKNAHNSNYFMVREGRGTTAITSPYFFALNQKLPTNFVSFFSTHQTHQ